MTSDSQESRTPGIRTTTVPTHLGEIDVGLRRHMLRVYNYMASGLVLTGIVAYVAAYSGFYAALTQTGFLWLVLLAPLGLVMLLGFRVQRMSFVAAQTTFWAYAALMGLSLAGIFLLYTGASIARVFFVAGGTFAAMSLYGYTTRTDLSKFGSFLMMGVVGVVLASIVHVFLASSALQFALSIMGVVVFVGLTAWDTQRIKEMYFDGEADEVMSKKALMGALALYLDFVNLFLLLLQFMGVSRQR